MKKVLSISIMVLLCFSISLAQFGIKGGINLGTFGGDDKGGFGVDPKAKLGLAGGISYKLGLLFGLSIQPEVLYVQKGAIYENPYHKTTIKFDYVDIPVLVKFNLPIPVLSPYIEGGLSYGILLSAKDKIEYTGGVLPSEEKDVKDLFIKNDLSLIMGVGVEVFIIDINARYIIGLTKLYKDDPTTTTVNEGDKKVYNRGIMLTVGIRF